MANMSYKKYIAYINYMIIVIMLIMLSFKCIDITIPKEKIIKIGATYMTMNNDFYKVLNSKIEKIAFYKKYRLIVRDSELDEKKQAQQIENFVKNKVNVIILNPVKSNSKVLNHALRKAKENRIPVVAVDAPIEYKDAISTTILSDNYEAGVLLAKYLMKIRSCANILSLEHKNVISATDRTRGFLDTIKKYPKYCVVGRLETYGQTEIAMPKVENAIEDAARLNLYKKWYMSKTPSYNASVKDSFDVIMALNDRAAIGALAAIEDKKVSDNTIIFGVDGSPDFKKFIEDNTHAEATVSQSISLMANKVSYVLDRLLKNKKVKLLYKIPVKLINKDNLYDYGKSNWE